MHRSNQRGVTLLEMMIAVVLVSLITVGLLYAMRVGLLAYEKINNRLNTDRTAMGLEQTLERQIDGVMPVAATCGGAPRGFFHGAADSARFVSSYSLGEGSRGYPRIVEYFVEPDPHGGVRLMMNEQPYGGPDSTTRFCSPGGFVPVEAAPQALEIAGGLAYCRFSFREAVPNSPLGGPWAAQWNQPDLPRAVRIDMAALHPNPAQLPILSLNVPIHVTREVTAPYADRY